jgi:hypothetical protein
MSRSGLQHALKKRAESQAEVLYVLTETRKELEALNLKAQYPDLVFFCDWTVHPKLSRSKVVEPLVTEFATAILETARLRTSAPITKRIRKMVSLDALREDLCKFLASQLLPVSNLTDDTFWAVFVVLYISIVQETPLELPNGDRLHLHCKVVGADSRNTKNRTVHFTEWVVTRNGVEIGAIENEGFMQTITETITMDASGKVTKTRTIR